MPVVNISSRCNVIIKHKASTSHITEVINWFSISVIAYNQICLICTPIVPISKVCHDIEVAVTPLSCQSSNGYFWDMTKERFCTIILHCMVNISSVVKQSWAHNEALLISVAEPTKIVLLNCFTWLCFQITKHFCSSMVCLVCHGDHYSCTRVSTRNSLRSAVVILCGILAVSCVSNGSHSTLAIFSRPCTVI